jgi:hypothetical protein
MSRLTLRHFLRSVLAWVVKGSRPRPAAVANAQSDETSQGWHIYDIPTYRRRGHRLSSQQWQGAEPV